MYNIQEETFKLEYDINVVLGSFSEDELSSLSHLQGFIFIEGVYSSYFKQYFHDEDNYLSFIEDVIGDIEDEEKAEEKTYYNQWKEVAYIAWGENQEIGQCKHYISKKDMEETENALSNIVYIKDKYSLELSDTKIENLVDIYTKKLIEENANQLKIELATKDTGAKRKIAKL